MQGHTRYIRNANFGKAEADTAVGKPCEQLKHYPAAATTTTNRGNTRARRYTPGPGPPVPLRAPLPCWFRFALLLPAVGPRYSPNLGRSRSPAHTTEGCTVSDLPLYTLGLNALALKGMDGSTRLLGTRAGWAHHPVYPLCPDQKHVWLLPCSNQLTRQSQARGYTRPDGAQTPKDSVFGNK